MICNGKESEISSVFNQFQQNVSHNDSDLLRDAPSSAASVHSACSKSRGVLAQTPVQQKRNSLPHDMGDGGSISNKKQNVGGVLSCKKQNSIHSQYGNSVSRQNVFQNAVPAAPERFGKNLLNGSNIYSAFNKPPPSPILHNSFSGASQSQDNSGLASNSTGSIALKVATHSAGRDMRELNESSCFPKVKRRLTDDDYFRRSPPQDVQNSAAKTNSGPNSRI